MNGKEKIEICILPEEILLKIFTYLSPYYHYQTAALVCKKWHRIIKSIIKIEKREFKNAMKDDNKLNYSKESTNNNGEFDEDRTPKRLIRDRSAVRRGLNLTYNHSNEPVPRFSHTACLMGDKMFIFGGCSVTNNSAFNDLNQYDLLTRQWQRVIVDRGFMPAPRECLSMVAYKGKLVLFGGWFSPRSSDVTAVPKFFNDTFLIDVESKSCSVVSCAEKETPQARAGHNACIACDKMIIFGGAQRILRYDDIWFLDMKNLCWYCPLINNKKPDGRFGHSQFSVGDSHIMIIGGCGGSNSLYDDAWLLDITTWSWCEIEVKNKEWKAPNLWCHPAVKIDEHIITYSDQTICNHCLGLQANPLESSLFSGPLPIPFTVCIQCKKNKVKKQSHDSHFQMFTLDCSELLNTRTISWNNSTSVVPERISLSRSLFTIVAAKAEILIFGGVYNSEKLVINNSPPSNIITVSARNTKS
eukprot:gene15176-16738_t